MHPEGSLECIVSTWSRSSLCSLPFSSFSAFPNQLSKLISLHSWAWTFCFCQAVSYVLERARLLLPLCFSYMLCPQLGLPSSLPLLLTSFPSGVGLSPTSSSVKPSLISPDHSNHDVFWSRSVCIGYWPSSSLFRIESHLSCGCGPWISTEFLDWG